MDLQNIEPRTEEAATNDRLMQEGFLLILRSNSEGSCYVMDLGRLLVPLSWQFTLQDDTKERNSIYIWTTWEA